MSAADALFPAVREAAEGELGALASVLARAFRADPVHRWMLPGELDWALFSAFLFRTVLRESWRAGGAHTTQALEGAALWFPPYTPPPPLGQRLGMALRGLVALGRQTAAVGRELARLEAARPSEPHWYLAVLGTDPRHQRRGVGAALIAPTLARCDADRMPAYLESSKRSNVAFYERHGFAVTGELDFADGPRLWRMRREPRAAP